MSPRLPREATAPLRAWAAFGAALVLSLPVVSTHASEASEEEEVRQWLGDLQAPLALSADGQWRVHVDAANVLHRVNLATPARAASLALPTRIQALAASRSGQKVALLTRTGCIALADFGSGDHATAQVSWRALPRWLGPQPDTSPARRTMSTQPWLAEAPSPCLDSANRVWGVGSIALSADGRLLATESEVVDLEAHRVLASRTHGPHEVPLLVRFVDGDRRLLTVDALLGMSGSGFGNVLSHVEVALWDLKSGALLSLSDRERVLDMPQSQLVSASTASGVVYGVNAPLPTVQEPVPPNALTAWRADACREMPARSLPLGGATGLAVDPLGRWIATTVRLVDDSINAPPTRGDTDELVVLDIASGRELARRAWKHALGGLVASADGTHLYALSTPSFGRWNRPSDAVVPGPGLGQVVDIALPAAALAGSPATAAQWPAQPCGEVAAAAPARAVTRVERALQPAWRVPTGGEAIASTECTATCAQLVVRRDGSLWLDGGATFVQLDPATGRRLRSLPTPRSDKVSSVAVPAADGFFNAQGDTLTWRPFDASAPGAPARRVVEVRPGHEIILLERQGDAVLVAWTPRQPKPAPGAETDAGQRPSAYAFYDASGKKVSERDGTEDWGGDGWPTSDELQHDLVVANLAPCHDETGALASGWDWRIGPFGSVVAWTCGPAAGSAQVALWSDIDIRPQNASRADAAPERRIVAHDGSIGVVDEAGRYRVFDAARHAELGQFRLPENVQAVTITVAARQGLVLVEGTDDAPAARTLRAYPYR